MISSSCPSSITCFVNLTDHADHAVNINNFKNTFTENCSVSYMHNEDHIVVITEIINSLSQRSLVFLYRWSLIKLHTTMIMMWIWWSKSSSLLLQSASISTVNSPLPSSVFRRPSSDEATRRRRWRDDVPLSLLLWNWNGQFRAANC